MEVLKKFNEMLYKAVKGISILMLAIMIILCLVQVFYRYILQLPLSFSEELARFIFIWITFLGTAMALKKHKHVKMELLVQTFPVKIQVLIKKIIFGVSILTYLLMIYSGFLVVNKTMIQTSAALKVPMGLIYLAVPLSGILMLLFEVDNFLQMYSKIKGERN